jgi:septal ring factor EnvC (AmiA/AmiB activator)
MVSDPSNSHGSRVAPQFLIEQLKTQIKDQEKKNVELFQKIKQVEAYSKHKHRDIQEMEVRIN